MPSENRTAAEHYQRLLSPLVGAAGEQRTKPLSEVLALVDFNATLSASRSAADVLDLTLLVAIGETAAPWAGVLLPDGTGRLVPGPVRGSAPSGWRDLALVSYVDPQPGTGSVFRSDEIDAGDASAPALLQELFARTGASLGALLTGPASLVGVLLLGESKRGEVSDDVPFLQLLVASAGASLANARAHEQLEQANRSLSLKVYQLHSLFDVSRDLNRPLEISQLSDALVTNAIGRVLTTRAALFVDGNLTLRGLKLDRDGLGRLAAACGGLDLECMMPVRELEPRNRDVFASLGLRLLVPIPTSENRVLLCLGARGEDVDPSADDMEFLKVLASQAGSAFDNLRLVESRAEKEKLDKEMAIAREIQRGLLPKNDPEIEGWDIAGINIPSHAVGGDYYDFIVRPDGALWVVIADVSGKGTGPALIMASFRSSLRALSELKDMSLESIAGRLNDIVQESTEMNKYVTAVFGSLDPATGALEYLNAGHCYPLILRRDGDVERLDEGGTVVGMLEKSEWQTAKTRLEPGDLMVMYTDGLSETTNVLGEDYDETKILAMMRKHADKSARELLGRLVSAARIFAAEAGLADDLTLVVLKRR